MTTIKIQRIQDGGRYGDGYYFECAECHTILEATDDNSKLTHPAEMDVGLFFTKIKAVNCQFVGCSVKNPDVFELPIL